MAIMEANPESDVLRVWGLLNELSEQLSQNRNASITLHNVTGGVKVRKTAYESASAADLYAWSTDASDSLADRFRIETVSR